MRTYQTHSDGEDATSDSFQKLERICLPSDLTGKSFLDIGCSEGFFCNAAAERGATRVVGIDVKTPSLEIARKTYSSPVIEFREQSWDTLPEGKFDVILLASAMHYEKDPAALLNRIADSLAPGGVFILECGVDRSPTREMVLVPRRRINTWMPTESYLTETLLKRFSSRRVGHPEKVGGDPTPRSVYHCTPVLTTVLVFRGGAQHGKSSTAKLFGQTASQSISLDWFLGRLTRAPFAHTPVQQFVVEQKHLTLGKLARQIDAAGFTEAYTDLIAQAISPMDETVVINGFMTDPQVQSLSAHLDGRALVWDSGRVLSDEQQQRISNRARSVAGTVGHDLPDLASTGFQDGSARPTRPEAGGQAALTPGQQRRARRLERSQRQQAREEPGDVARARPEPWPVTDDCD
jgi:SAM-dependent methyltransferase